MENWITTPFEPLSGLTGGILIGLSVVLLLLTLGRIAGISGIAAGALTQRGSEQYWRLAFLIGMLLAAIIYKVFLGGFEKALQDAGGEAFITADHGNVEQMLDETGKPATSHSTLPVPLFYIGREAKLKDGRLCDIAPTMLKVLDLSQPKEMTGECLL